MITGKESLLILRLWHEYLGAKKETNKVKKNNLTLCTSYSTPFPLVLFTVFGCVFILRHKCPV